MRPLSRDIAGLLAASAIAGGVFGVAAATLFIAPQLAVTPPSLPATQHSAAADAAASDARATSTLLGAGPSLVHRSVADAFVAEYDFTSRNPRFVCERLTRDSLAGSASRDGVNFFEDTSLPPSARARLSAYAGSGFDRGHLAPAADHRATPDSLHATFSLANVSPQRPEFNRSDWASFEAWVRALTQTFGAVHVVTGPAFLPRPSGFASRGAQRWTYGHEAIGDAGAWIAIPTHFYKVVYAFDGDANAPTRAAVGAFLLPHKLDGAPSTALASAAVPLSVVETITGLTFFPSVKPSPAAPSFRDAAAAAEAAATASRLTSKTTPIVDAGVLARNAVAILGAGAARDAGRGERASGRAPPRGAPPLRHLCEEVDCVLTPSTLHSVVRADEALAEAGARADRRRLHRRGRPAADSTA